jgi:hypothetical protein
MYSSESPVSREEQVVPSPTRSRPQQQSVIAPKAMSIASLEVSQSTSLNSSMFDAYEASPLAVAPGPSTNLSSESGDLKPSEYFAATRISLRKSNMPAKVAHIEMPRPFPSRLLQPKEQPPAKMVLVSKLVSQVICSFPERKMNGTSCPPFIHQSKFPRWINVIPSDDPMVICQDISRKFAAREARVDFSVWDAIASEQERIYDQRASFDKWLHLSSAQALTIYLLMLTAEGESVLTHHPSLPITLLFTLRANFDQLNRIHPGFVAAKEQSGGRPAWEDWIFAESKLRTATIYFILTLHFNLEFGLPCDREVDSDFEDVELPAAKRLWEAKNELSWSEEFDLTVPRRDNFVNVRTSKARLKYRDLVRLNKRNRSYEYADVQKDESALADRIEKWHKEMDEFGMLVALCGTMV